MVLVYIAGFALSQVIGTCLVIVIVFNLFRVSYGSILHVAGTSIPVFGSQVRLNSIFNSRHLASYLVYETEGVVRVQQGDRDIRNQSTHWWG
jgi:hypothetical protein